MQIFGTSDLRNIALASHSGTGKTTLTEAMLLASGMITRAGRIEDGTTTSDYEPEEAKRQSSTQLAVVPCVWADHKLNLLDTPGYADFLGEVVTGLHVADSSLVLIDASAGVEVGTEIIWREMGKRSLPRLVFVNKMDRENADFGRCLDSIQNKFGKHCVALQFPVGYASSFQGIEDLLDPSIELSGEAAPLRERLLEAVAETDDELATRYLEGETLSVKELHQALSRGVSVGKIIPVLLGSAVRGIGVSELLDFLISCMPSPAAPSSIRKCVDAQGNEVEIPSDSDAPLVAQVFKTTADPFVGRLSSFRVYRGTFRSNSEVRNASRAHTERVAQILVLRGKAQEPVNALAPGDIGSVTKLATTVTGDTLVLGEHPVQMPSPNYPVSTYSVAVYPRDKGDLDKMAIALTRLAEEDPSLRIHRQSNTNETLMAGLGDVHVEVAVARARRKFGLELLVQPPKVSYLETVTATAKAEYKHKKQSGGHGQYGHVLLEVEPLERGAGFEFGSRVVGGNVPKEYIPGVEKGVSRAIQDGVVAGYPVVDLRVTLYDGSSHPVDSSAMAFEVAASHAVKLGVSKAQPALLEPIMVAQIDVPDAFTGEIMGDMNSRRARILGITQGDGVTHIQSEVPQAEMLRYATELRSMTQGQGAFTMDFTRYDPVPSHLTQQIVDSSQKGRESA